MFHKHIVPCLFVLVIVAGCASTKVSNRQVLVNERIPRPDRILVYDFIANPAEMPLDSALQFEPGPPLTAEQIQAGHQLGALIADDRVAQIRDMGLPAVRGLSGT